MEPSHHLVCSTARKALGARLVLYRSRALPRCRPLRSPCPTRCFLRDTASAVEPAPVPAVSEPEEEALQRMVLDLAVELDRQQHSLRRQLELGPASEPEAEIEQGLALQLAVRETSLQAALQQLALSSPLAVLSCADGCGGQSTFYVIGTAHASEASCQDVAALIRAVQPEMVMVELCRERAPLLFKETFEEPPLQDVLRAIRRGQTTAFAGIYSWLLAKVARNLGVMPGGEFRAALREAKAVDAPVALGDRPMSITLARVWSALSAWDKARILGSLLYMGLRPMDSESMKLEIESMKETDVLTGAMQAFAKDFPTLMRPLITERDEFMVYIMRHKLAPRARSVVVVVGAGHLQGIKEKWESEVDFDEIMRVP